MRIFIVALSIAMIGQISFAQSRAYHYVPPTETKQGASTDEIARKMKEEEARKDKDTIMRQAEKASKAQKGAMLVSTVAAAYAAYQSYVNAVKCASCKGFCGACAKSIAWGIGAAYSAKQAMEMSKAKSSSDLTRDRVTTDENSGAPVPDKTGDPETDIANNPNIRDAVEKLNKSKDKTGVDINLTKGTVTTKDGKVIDIGSASAEDLATLGTDMGQIGALVQEAYQEAQKKLGTAGVDKLDGDVIDGDNGNVSTTAGFGIDYVEGNGLGSPEAMNAKKIDRDPAKVAGLTKNFNGNPIGVSEENIFTLINRRYEVKATTFILNNNQ